MNKLSRRQLADYAVKELIKGASPKNVASRLVAELHRTGRQRQSDLLIKDIYGQLESAKHLSLAHVSSARPLHVSTSKLIKELVIKQTGVKDVEIAPIIDESLIGGVQISTPTFSWDGSISSQLKRLVSEKRIKSV